MLPLRARVDRVAMARKGYSAFPKAPALLEPHDQIVLCHIQDTRWGGLTPLQRSSRCILQPQPTGQPSLMSNCLLIILVIGSCKILYIYIYIYIYIYMTNLIYIYIYIYIYICEYFVGDYF